MDCLNVCTCVLFAGGLDNTLLEVMNAVQDIVVCAVVVGVVVVGGGEWHHSYKLNVSSRVCDWLMLFDWL